MQGMFRRGDLWWARLVVPARLRAAVGRREFVCSTRCTDRKLAQVVAAGLLANWRQQLYSLDTVTNDQIAAALNSNATLKTESHLPLVRASELLELDQRDLLRAVQSGEMSLFLRLPGGLGDGYLIGFDKCERDLPYGDFIVPMTPPSHATYLNIAGQNTKLSKREAEHVADSLMAETKSVLVGLDMGDGNLFVPAVGNIGVDLSYVSLSCQELSRYLGRRLKATQPERLRSVARSIGALPSERKESVTSAHLTPNIDRGKWAERSYAEAVSEYLLSKDGIRRTVARENEIKRAGLFLMGFSELVLQPDCKLIEVSEIHYERFRDSLSELPANANQLKGYQGLTASQTISKFKDDAPIDKAGNPWPKISADQREKRCHFVQRFFHWLEDRRMLTPNPIKHIQGSGLTKVEKIKSRAQKKSDSAVPFDGSDLARIFSAERYRVSCERFANGNARHTPSTWWAPLIGLYSGLRVNEIAQLYVHDITEVDGIPCFRIAEDPDDKNDKRVKTHTSVRTVPIHPELRRLGLLDWWSAVKSEGYLRLWPELPYKNNGEGYSYEVKRQINDVLLPSLGFSGSNKTFHSTRGTFNRQARSLNPELLMPEVTSNNFDVVLRNITGHAAGDVNNTHYSSANTNQKLKLVSSVSYPGMPTIHPYDVASGLEVVKKRLGKRGETAKLGIN